MWVHTAWRTPYFQHGTPRTCVHARWRCTAQPCLLRLGLHGRPQKAWMWVVMNTHEGEEARVMGTHHGRMCLQKTRLTPGASSSSSMHTLTHPEHALAGFFDKQSHHIPWGVLCSLLIAAVAILYRACFRWVWLLGRGGGAGTGAPLFVALAFACSVPCQQAHVLQHFRHPYHLRTCHCIAGITTPCPSTDHARFSRLGGFCYRSHGMLHRGEVRQQRRAAQHHLLPFLRMHCLPPWFSRMNAARSAGVVAV